MPQTTAPTREQRWRAICRDDFDLTPEELGTLVAVVSWHQTQDAAPCPLEELQRLERELTEDYELDANNVPALLVRKGLLKRHGTHMDRRFSPTLRGLQRIRL